VLFNSFEFIFIFLPVALAGYLIIGRLNETPIARLLWLALTSLAFYGYWNVWFLPVIGISIGVNFLFALAIVRFRTASTVILAGAVAANLAALGFYKYANFGIGIVNAMAAHPLPLLSVALPLGMSFFTFTQIAYLADVARGRASEPNFVKYVVFVTYFPHLIAGPILHHREMMPQLDAAPARLSSERVAIASTIFIIGLFKKAVIADYMASIADPIFAAAVTSPLSSVDAWGGPLAYSLQIYFDFSGYCDMAIGLSLLFGIVLPFNFDAPYRSQSIAEFWHRWHITLSRFLRDYLYIPLGGNRRGEARRSVNLAVTMLLGGLWHGAGWTFVVWGALHGLYLIVNHRWATLRANVPVLARAAETSLYVVFSVALTQLCIVVAWVFFRADSLTTALGVLRAMFGPLTLRPVVVPTREMALALGLIVAGYIACLVLPNVNELFREKDPVGIETYRLPQTRSLVPLQWSMRVPWAVFAATLFVAALVAILAQGEGSPFLYFQF
jgi:alginate O-acetyltransferase complex protein AlgI